MAMETASEVKKMPQAADTSRTEWLQINDLNYNIRSWSYVTIDDTKGLFLSLIHISRGDLGSYLCEKARVISVEYGEDGTLFNTVLSKEDYQRLKDYEVV